MTNSVEQKKHLEEFLMSDDLEELKNLTDHFNIFNALKLQNNEIRHSNFLSWLMAPYESHKIGDYFLKEFLKSALKRFSLNKNIDSEINEIVFADFNDAEIRREYKNIDILVINPKNKFLYVIENKIWTGEHDCQLERYAQIVNSEFGNYKKLYIYLSPANDDTCDLLDRKYDDKSIFYIPMSYTQVNEVLDKILKFKNMNISSEVALFIKHYKQMIERNIMGNTDEKIVELCRKIYREHKDAIDLINEHSDARTEIFEILQEVLSERKDIEITENGTANIKFIPKGIDNIQKLKEISADGKSISQLQIINFTYRNMMYIEITVGATDNKNTANINKRNSLKEHLIKEVPISKFNGKDDWSYTPSECIMTMEDYYKCDSKEEVKAFISEKLNSLQDKYIVAYKNALNSWNPEK